MKNLSLTILLMAACLCSSQKSMGQASGNFYNDARSFYNELKEKRLTAKSFGIMSYYFGETITANNFGRFLVNDPILGTIIKTTDTVMIVDRAPAIPAGVSSNILSTNVARYADGAAKFLIDRGKMEIATTFFARLSDELNRYPELKLLLPRTFDVVATIEAFNYQHLIQELKDALTKDLMNLPKSMLDLRDADVVMCRDNADCQRRLQAMIDCLTIGDPRPIVLSLLALQEIINGRNIIDVINTMALDRTICSVGGSAIINDNFSGYLKLSAIMLRMFQGADSDGSLFITQTQIKDLFTTPDLFKVFLALGYEKYQGPNNKLLITQSQRCLGSFAISGSNLQVIFATLIKQQEIFAAALMDFDNINAAAVAIARTERSGNKVDAEQYAALMASSLGLLTKVTKATDRVMGTSLITPTNTQLFTNMELVSEIAVDITKKNYAGIFNDISRLITVNTIMADVDARNRLIKYLAFAANMAAATSSDEVKEAIDAIALPPGSFSVKQKTAYSISVNGFIGYAWDFNGGLYMRGVYAPIGFTFSMGLGKKHGGALSIFTSIIDIGGVAAYRLQDESTEELKQEVRLESIFSPSAQLQFAIPKTPLTLTAGWRGTPKLFYSGETEPFKTVDSKNVFNVSLLVDVPIATLFSRAYR